MSIKLVELTNEGFSFVKEVYDYYILNSTATFHTDLVSEDELKIAIFTNHPKYKSYLIDVEGKNCGYCYFSPFNKRQAYDRTAEITIYLKPEFVGKGIGKETLRQMEKIATNCHIKVLIGGITAENQDSIKLFEKCGFEKCAHYKNVGQKFNRLLDVVAYQKIID